MPGEYSDIITVSGEMVNGICSSNIYIENIQGRFFYFFFPNVLGKALEIIRTDVFAQSYCRKTAKIMMTITDGYSSDDVALSAVELRDMGVVMLGVGFGNETPLMRYTLESLSSDMKSQFTFIFGYDRLIEAVQEISKKTCAGI